MKIPGIAKGGCVVALIGGIIAVAGLALYFKPANEAVTDLAFYMLVAVLFFAMAGGFVSNNQWNQNVFLFMGFLTVAVIVACTVTEHFDIVWAVVEAAVAVVVIAIGYSSGVKNWIESAGA